MPARTADEIRASIEQNREELGKSLDQLRGEVVRLTDWRAQLRLHQKQAIIGAALAGFVLGGGIAGISGLLIRGRRERKARKRGS